MFLALVVVAGLAYLDEDRESKATLDDFASEQATLAAGLSANLSARLATVRRDALIAAEDLAEGRRLPATLLASYSLLRVRAGTAPVSTVRPEAHAMVVSIPTQSDTVIDLGVAPSSMLANLSHLERPGELLLLLQPAGSSVFYTSDGRTLATDRLRDALDQGKTSIRLSRPEASALGLPERTAYAGLGSADGGPLGRWGIAVIASARAERDREVRARWRLVLGVLVPSGLVLAFGGAALRRQRKQLLLERELALAEVENAQNQRLERATRIAIMGTFAMGIAHEVSTPLGVIVGRAEQVLARVAGDERAANSTRIILGQADRIQSLIRSFLDLARGGPPALARVEPGLVAASAVALVNHRFAKADVALRADIPPDLPPIQCDRGLMEHAIVNLLLNACEACVAGGVVELVARTEGQNVAFVVCDDGSGITDENAARATEPFFTTKAEGKGTGLGLAITSEIVKSHRGTLSIEPRSPRGTRACVQVPVAPGEARHAA